MDVMMMKTDLMEKVLREISQEREQVDTDWREACRKAEDLVEATNEENRGIVKEKTDTEADVRAFERYEGRLAKQEYDAEHRRLVKVRDEAKARFTASEKQFKERIAPLQERITHLQTKAAELKKEWEAHLRLAKASGVDAKKYWTPENAAVKNHVPLQPKQ